MSDEHTGFCWSVFAFFFVTILILGLTYLKVHDIEMHLHRAHPEAVEGK